VRYRNKEFRFEFEYSVDDWEPEEIEGQNSGIMLLNRHYRDDAPLIVVKGWFPPQIFDDWVIRELGKVKAGKYFGKKRIIKHVFYDKPLEVFIDLKKFGIQFLLTGKKHEETTKEFMKIVKTFKYLDEKK
jgi:hypothetical protein